MDRLENRLYQKVREICRDNEIGPMELAQLTGISRGRMRKLADAELEPDTTISHFIEVCIKLGYKPAIDFGEKLPPVPRKDLSAG